MTRSVLLLVVSAGLWGCTVNSTTNNNGTDGGTSGGDDTCNADTTVSCMEGAGWSCTGSDTPEDHQDLVCSSGTSDTGKTDYCCVPSTGVTTSCSFDSSVSCQEGTGYSCTSTDSPDQSDSSLVCSSGTASGSVTQYCCTPYNSSGTCQQDPSVMGCTGASYGFTCSGPDSPSASDSSLNCSSGTSDNMGNTLYCCE